MDKRHKSTIRLRGIRSANHAFESKAWLDSHYLKLEKSLGIKAYSLNGFDWGDNEKGGLQFALAVCLELYPLEVAKKVHPAFYQAVLITIEEDGFDVNFDIEAFNRQHGLSV